MEKEVEQLKTKLNDLKRVNQKKIMNTNQKIEEEIFLEIKDKTNDSIRNKIENDLLSYYNDFNTKELQKIEEARQIKQNLNIMLENLKEELKGLIFFQNADNNF